MAIVEKIERELEEAEEQLRKAENELKEFNEGDGQWLEELKGKLQRKEYEDEMEKKEWKEEKDGLDAREKELRDDVRQRLKQVETLQNTFAAMAAPTGNDFVTWALEIE